MFSDKEAIVIEDNSEDLWSLIEDILDNIATKHHITAILLLKCDTPFSCDLLCCINIDKSPLQGNEKQILFDIISECSKHNKKPHIHKINDDLLKKYNAIIKNKNAVNQVLFISYLLDYESYLAICFQSDRSIKIIPESLHEQISDVVLLSKKIYESDALIARLHTLENYVKEVGHDFASSVQSTIPKLNNIAEGHYDGDLLKEKALEAENEIWSAYRYAANLGLVVEPNYTIKNGDHFDLISTANEIIRQYQSEADERHISIIFNCDLPELIIWGDNEAIASAISHLLLNALKYSFGSSRIKIIINNLGAEIELKIINKGIPLHNDEVIKIWKCGFRGREAYERHVNGCGIGLYTVKKIVKGHDGNVFCKSIDRENSEFSFRIPKNRPFLKPLL